MTAEQSARSRDTIAWAGAVNLIGGGLGAIINLVLAALVGRHLGPDGAGSYFLVVAVFLITANVAELGADTGLIRFLAGARVTGRTADIPIYLRTAIRPVLVVGALVAAAGLALARPLADVVPGVGTALAAVAAIVVTAASMSAVMLAVTRGLGDVLTFPLLQSILLPMLRVVGVGAVVVAGGGVAAILAAWLAPIVVVLALATVVAWRLVAKVRPGSDPREDAGDSTRGRAFWAFSAPRGVAAAVEIMLEWVDVILVGLLASPEAAGIYAVVTRCVRASEIVQQAARIAIGPQISAAFARGAHDEVRHIYGLVSAAMIWLAWPFFLLLAIFGDAVLSIFGDAFTTGHRSLVILTAAMALATAAGTVQSILLMGGRSTWQLADKSLALALNIALDLLFIPWWGIEGAALAWAITIVVDTALVVWQVQRLMGIRPPYRPLLRALTLAVVVAGGGACLARLTFGSSLTTLGLTTLVLGVAYLALSWRWRERLGLAALVLLRSR